MLYTESTCSGEYKTNRLGHDTTAKENSAVCCWETALQMTFTLHITVNSRKTC